MSQQTTTTTSNFVRWLLLLAVALQVASNGAAPASTAANSNLSLQSARDQNDPVAPRLVESWTRKNYFGTLIDKLNSHSQPQHGISGDVYAIDEQTLFIRNFNFDGQAPDTYFWSSAVSPRPSAFESFIVPDEKGSTKPLQAYVNKDVVLRLPEGKTLREINWLSIWSRHLQKSLADVAIRHDQLVIPRPIEIAPLTNLAHGVRSGPITIVDAQTFLVSEFHYDGLGPDAFFWLASNEEGKYKGGLNPRGFRLKDENGSSNVLHKYQGETIVISLPDELTIYDFDFFGVWCRKFKMSFGQTQIPSLASGHVASLSEQNNIKVPPSPKMLGIKPENKLNCEILYDDLGFEIRWVLDGDDIVMQLVGKIEQDEYMAFGLGKNDSRSEMNYADAVVSWVDRQTGQVHAHDYYLGGKSQCGSQESLVNSSCPDVKLPNGSDSLTLLHGAIVNGYSMVTFKRPQLGVDDQYDQHVYSDGQQSIIWAIGVLNKNKEVGYHRLRNKVNMFIDFARNPQWNCPIPDLNASMSYGSGGAQGSPSISPAASHVDQTIVQTNSNVRTADTYNGIPTNTGKNNNGNSEHLGNNNKMMRPILPVASLRSPNATFAQGAAVDGGQHTERPQQPQDQHVNASEPQAWFIPAIVCPSDRTFYTQIGPVGGPRKGFAALTGRGHAAPWDVSWYVNGLMAPELVVERGQVYKFIVEGGNDKIDPNRRHPLYITDAQDGGFNYKTDDERQREQLFGGVAIRTSDGQFVPTAEGRLCEWKQTNATNRDPDNYQTFATYQRTLKLECKPGQASVLKFAPDSNTPNTVYYQCYTHRNMGWKIHVVDSCSAYMQQQQRQQHALFSNLVNNKNAIFISNLKRRDLSNVVPPTVMPPTVDQNPQKIEKRNSFSVFDFFSNQASNPQISFESPPPDMWNQVQSPSTSGGDLNPLSSDQHMGLRGPNENLIAASLLNSLQSPAAIKQIAAMFDNSSRQPDKENGLSALLEQHLQWVNASSQLEQFISNAPPRSSEGDFISNEGNQIDLFEALRLSSQMQPQQHQPETTLDPIQIATMLYKQKLTESNNQTANKTVTKQPKGLNFYVRRLASIYYPVQQLASMISSPSQTGTGTTTTPTPTPTSMTQKNSLSDARRQKLASAASTSNFAFANLVPKPKIDLTKSNIGKKLSNKFRIKSGKKYESNQPLKPPTPANEFNYNIFNNQLAQIEKQQKQLQALETLATAAAAGMPFATLYPGQMELNRPDRYLLSQSTDHILNSARLNGFSDNSASPSMQQLNDVNPFANYFGPQINFGKDALENTFLEQTGITHQSGFYGEGVNQTRTPENSMPQTSSSNHDWPQPGSATNSYDKSALTSNNWQQQTNKQHQTGTQFQSAYNNDPRQAVFITRYPLNQVYMESQNGVNESPSSTHQTSRYTGSQANSLSSKQQPSYLAATDYSRLTSQTRTHDIGNQQSSLNSLYVQPPSDLANNFSATSNQQLQATSQERPTSEIESLSGSGSGAHYAFRPNTEHISPQSSMSNFIDHSSKNINSPELDHMLAIERFSKQSSDRRPPSIVHPITGEHILGLSFETPESSQHLHDSNLFPQSNPTRPTGAYQPGSQIQADKQDIYQNELLESEQSMIHASDLSRLNATNDQRQWRQLLNNQERPPTLIKDSAGGENFFHSSTTSPTSPVRHVANLSGVELASNQGPASMEQKPHIDNAQSSTTEASISPVLLRPFASIDFFASDPPATTTMPGLTVQPSTEPSISIPMTTSGFVPTVSSVPSISSSTESGPLAPTWPSPATTMQSASTQSVITHPNDVSNNQHAEQQLFLKSNLIEPISSTLIPHPIDLAAREQHHYEPSNKLTLDTGPFIPIELNSNTQFPQQRQLDEPSHNSPTLRPPTFLESMLSQYREPARSQQPLQVASHLTSHLIGHYNNPNRNQQNPVAANMPDEGRTSTILKNTEDRGQKQNQTQQPDLIILRPSVITSSRSPKSYALKPEYLVTRNSLKVHDESETVSSGRGRQSSDESSARRLAYQQFERLSSLSSPPSTSMALDPMQVANSVTNFLKTSDSSNPSVQSNDESKRRNTTSSSNGNKPEGDSKISDNSLASDLISTNEVPSDSKHLSQSQHRQSVNDNLITLKETRKTTIPLPTRTTMSSIPSQYLDHGISPVNDSHYNLNRTYDTDNAILSHVMSLISSNAIPTPPLIPTISNADYFLPISDRTNRSIKTRSKS